MPSRPSGLPDDPALSKAWRLACRPREQRAWPSGSAKSSPPSKAQGAMTESRRGPLLASERTPRKAPASWTLVAAEPALRGGLGAVTNCCHAAKPLSPSQFGETRLGSGAPIAQNKPNLGRGFKCEASSVKREKPVVRPSDFPFQPSGELPLRTNKAKLGRDRVSGQRSTPHEGTFAGKWNAQNRPNFGTGQVGDNYCWGNWL